MCMYGAISLYIGVSVHFCILSIYLYLSSCPYIEVDSLARSPKWSLSMRIYTGVCLSLFLWRKCSWRRREEDIFFLLSLFYDEKEEGKGKEEEEEELKQEREGCSIHLLPKVFNPYVDTRLHTHVYTYTYMHIYILCICWYRCKCVYTPVYTYICMCLRLRYIV